MKFQDAKRSDPVRAITGVIPRLTPASEENLRAECRFGQELIVILCRSGIFWRDSSDSFPNYGTLTANFEEQRGRDGVFKIYQVPTLLFKKTANKRPPADLFNLPLC